jgi:hypothetical protein
MEARLPEAEWQARLSPGNGQPPSTLEPVQHSNLVWAR